MRRVMASVVMILGLALLALAVAVLVWHGLSLPAPSVQTESQWAAYRLHRWAFLFGGLPLGLGMFLAGYLLWPGRLVNDSLARPLAIVGTLVALAALGAAGFIVWSAVQYREPFLQAPWLAVQGGTLLGGLAVLAVLAVRRLVGRLPGVRVESPDETKGESNEEVGNE
jgi:ABC-type Na+ efflux pump permease subunit